MIVVCIDNNKYIDETPRTKTGMKHDISINKIYVVHKESTMTYSKVLYYHIINDIGKTHQYRAERFKLLEDVRNEIIDKII